MANKTACVVALGYIPDAYWDELHLMLAGYLMYQSIDMAVTHFITDFDRSGLPTDWFWLPTSFASGEDSDSPVRYYLGLFHEIADVRVFGYGPDPVQREALTWLSSVCHQYSIPYEITLYG